MSINISRVILEDSKKQNEVKKKINNDRNSKKNNNVRLTAFLKAL